MDNDDLILEQLAALFGDSQWEEPPTGSCSKPQIAELIDMLGYRFLLQTLALDEATFAPVYPGAEHKLTVSIRKGLKESITKHYKQCPHCQSVAKNQKERSKELEKSLKKNNQSVKAILNAASPRRGLRPVK